MEMAALAVGDLVSILTKLTLFYDIFFESV